MNYSPQFERQYPWTQIGFLSAVKAALAVDGRDNASVVAFADNVSGVMTDGGGGDITVASTAHGLTTGDFVTITANTTHKHCLFTTAAAGAAVNVKSENHGLVTGDWVIITGTDDYNGTEQITRVDADNFTFVDTFVSAQYGDWRVHDYAGAHQITVSDVDNFTFVDTYVRDITTTWRAYKTVIWRPDDGTVAGEIRFRTDGTDGDDVVINIYAARGADYYNLMATYTMIVGSQDWSGGHFIDDITETVEYHGYMAPLATAVNGIGRIVFNTGGYDRFLFIATTLDPDTLYIDIARRDMQIW